MGKLSQFQINELKSLALSYALLYVQFTHQKYAGKSTITPKDIQDEWSEFENYVNSLELE